jgi:hypothetical protein
VREEWKMHYFILGVLTALMPSAIFLAAIFWKAGRPREGGRVVPYS